MRRLRFPSTLFLYLGLIAACLLVLTFTSQPAASSLAPQATVRLPTRLATRPLKIVTPTPEIKLPKPRLCNPQSPQLSPFAQIAAIDKSELGSGTGAAQGVYINPETQQEFRVTAHSANSGKAIETLSNLRVCFEAIDTGLPQSNGKVDANPSQELRFARAIVLEGVDNTFYVLEWTNRDEKENLFVVYFAIDPDVPGGGTDGYQARCISSATLGLDLSSGSGSVTGTLYKRATPVASVRANAASRPLPPTVSNSNGRTNITYDAAVRNNSRSTRAVYMITGSWTEDGSGVSSNVPGC